MTPRSCTSLKAILDGPTSAGDVEVPDDSTRFAVPQGTKAFFAKPKARGVPVEARWLNEQTQQDLYHEAAAVTAAAEAVV